MNTSRRNAFIFILLGGSLAATLDLLYAFIYYGSKGAKPSGILQSIASGVLGVGGVEYPEVHFTARLLEQKEALEFLVPRIAMIGSTILEEGSVDVMYADVEKLYPDFFAPSDGESKPQL